MAEVLITLGIIGIVASMTIPTLMAKNQKSEAYTALQKAFSVISSATAQMREDNGGSMADLATDTLGFADVLKTYLHVIKSCTTAETMKDCYLPSTSTITGLSGQTFSGEPNLISSAPKLVTSDGFVFIVNSFLPQCDGVLYKKNDNNEFCSQIFVDINGTKKPNTVSKDIFVFSINKFNTTPYIDTHQKYSTVEESLAHFCNKDVTSSWSGMACAYKAIMDGGIKYY